MHSKLFLFLPLIWGILYALSALLVKRAFAHHVGPWRTLFLSNLMLGLVAIPFCFFEKKDVTLIWYAEPLLVTVIFFTGQVCTTFALFRGDVSISTPVLGSKVLIVAFMTRLILKEEVPLLWWVAASLSVFGVFLLATSKDFSGKRSMSTLFFSLGAATCYGIADVLTQKYTPIWGAGKFIPVWFLEVALLSFICIPLFKESLFKIDRLAWKWLGWGLLIGALQCLGMAITIGHFGSATAINIVYSLRGVWSLVLVLAIGHWIQSQEHLLGRKALAIRFLGACSLVTAVIIVMVH